MRVDFIDFDGEPEGIAIVGADGVVFSDTDWINDIISRLFVVSRERGPENPVKPEEGEAFLRALPGGLLGHQLKAVFVE